MQNIPSILKHATPVQAITRKYTAYIESYSYTGLVVGVLFYCLSMLPSLLPRPWLFQALISGISLAIGYGVGSGIAGIWKWLGLKQLNKRFMISLWRVSYLIVPIAMVSYIYMGSISQREVHLLAGAAPPDSAYAVRVFFISVIVAAGLILASRQTRRLARYFGKRLTKIVPERTAKTLGVILATLFTIWFLSGALFNSFITAANHLFASRNKITPAGITQPQQSERSGSPASLISWDSLGREGRVFTGSGPSTAQIQEYHKTPTKQPIRIYAGLDSAPTPVERARLVVAELQRTHAFDRKILIVATPTGSGWLESEAMDSVEYMNNGDTAIASQQYSFLPSWISYISDGPKAQETGRALFDEVFAAWSDLPQDKRPKLIAYGLSLGSQGGQAAYTGPGGLRNTVDGAMFVGTPNTAPLWRTITSHRDTGSPEWQPVYQGGTSIRFASDSDDIRRDQSVRNDTRILYLQHASDPITWFSFDLILNKPDWLREPRGKGVSPDIKWYPFVTFVQLGIDQFFGGNMPLGHGHNYGDTMVAAWEALTEPADWSREQSNRLQKLIVSYHKE